MTRKPASNVNSHANPHLREVDKFQTRFLTIDMSNVDTQVFTKMVHEIEDLANLNCCV